MLAELPFQYSGDPKARMRGTFGYLGQLVSDLTGLACSLAELSRHSLSSSDRSTPLTESSLKVSSN